MAVQLAVEAQPGIVGEVLLQPATGPKSNILLAGVGICPDQQAAVSVRHIVQLQAVMPLAGAASCFTDECGQSTVTGTVCGQKNHLYLVNQAELGANNQLQ